MRYEMMRPGQIADAIEKGVPLLIPVGVLEYHGHQNPVGTDALIAQGIAHRVEAQVECVVAPTVFYGYTGQWAAGEELGEIHIDGDALFAFVRPIVRAFFRQGWKRIYIICHHQGEKGVTRLSYQRAATEAAMAYGLEERGPGWHRYRQELGARVFEAVHVVSDAEYSERAYGGHGGRDETSAMMYLYPETVDLEELKAMAPRPYWARDAHEASAELGAEIGQAIVRSWVERLEADRGR